MATVSASSLASQIEHVHSHPEDFNAWTTLISAAEQLQVSFPASLHPPQDQTSRPVSRPRFPYQIVPVGNQTNP